MEYDYFLYIELSALTCIILMIIIIFIAWLYKKYGVCRIPFDYLTGFTNFSAEDHKSSDELISLNVMTEENTELNNKLTANDDLIPNTTVADTVDIEENAKIEEKNIVNRIFEGNHNEYTTEVKWNRNLFRLQSKSVQELNKVPDKVLSNATI